MNLQIKEIEEGLRNLIGEKLLSERSLVRIEKQRDILKEASKVAPGSLFKIAIIGEQSGGKSSILNSFLDLRLPADTAKTDRFPIYIYPAAHKDFDGCGEVLLTDGTRHLLATADDVQSLRVLFAEKKWDQLSRIKSVKLAHTVADLFQKVIFINTPGLKSDERAINAVVEKVVAEADLVYWVFDIGSSLSLHLDASVRNLLAKQKRRVRVVISQIDKLDVQVPDADRIANREKRGKEFLDRLVAHFGNDLIDESSALIYSAVDVLRGNEAGAQYRERLEQSFFAHDAWDPIQERENQRFDRVQVALKSLDQTLAAEIREVPVKPSALTATKAKLLESVKTNTAGVVGKVPDLIDDEATRLSGTIGKIVKDVIHDRIGFWSALGRGAVGWIKSDWSLAAAVNADIKKGIKDNSDDVRQLMNRMETLVREELIREAIRKIEFDMQEGMEHLAAAAREGKIGVAIDHKINLQSIDWLTASLLRVFSKIMTEEVKKAVVKKLQDKVMSEAAKTGGEAVAKEAGQAMAKVAAETGGKTAAKLISDILSVWLLVTLPLDLLELYQKIGRDKDALVASVDDLMEEAKNKIIHDFQWEVREFIYTLRGRLDDVFAKYISDANAEAGRYEQARRRIEDLREAIGGVLAQSESSKF